MSRARRKPRHARVPRLVRTATPIAVGGAVAAVALTASPLSDALRRPAGGATAAQPPGDGGTRTGPGVLRVEPATAAGADSLDGAAGTSAERARAGGASRSDQRSAPGAAAGTPASTERGGTTTRRETTTAASGTATGDPTRSTRAASASSTPRPGSADPSPADQPSASGLPVPLPTALPTSLPTVTLPLP